MIPTCHNCSRDMHTSHSKNCVYRGNVTAGQTLRPRPSEPREEGVVGRRLEPNRRDCHTTDHSDAIMVLNRKVEEYEKNIRAIRAQADEMEREMHRMGAAAELLQCHDDTGISLEKFGLVRDFVEDIAGGKIVENGV